MTVLVMGANGMLGHAACRVFARAHDVFGTCRGAAGDHPELASVLPASRLFAGFDAGDTAAFERILDECRPFLVLNCIGIVKQRREAEDPVPSITVNSLWPHQAAAACTRHGATLVQVSTDCVFSGRRGGYREDEVPDPVDLYGRSKLLGEVTAPGHLTIRTSIIGRELRAPGTATTGLLEWFLAQRGGSVRGYARAIFSGLTTRALSELLLALAARGPLPAGLFHIASAPISKFELLRRIGRALDLGIRIERDDEFSCDRSLDGSRFVHRTGLAIPSWDAMIEDLAAEGSDDQTRRTA